MTKRLPAAVRCQRLAAGAFRLQLRVADRAVHRRGKHDRRFPTPANGASESRKSNPFDLKKSALAKHRGRGPAANCGRNGRPAAPMFGRSLEA
jgi:hypothetical protein